MLFGFIIKASLTLASKAEYHGIYTAGRHSRDRRLRAADRPRYNPPNTLYILSVKIANPTASLHFIEGSGHSPMFKQPMEFYPMLFEILGRPQ